MIKLFSQTDTSFSTNGDKIIIPLRAKVHKEDNGSFYLDFECSLDYINDIISGNIIVAPTPQGEQAFRISNVTATRTKLSAKCYHVFYDSKNYLIEDSYVVDKNCNDALDHLNSSTSDISPFATPTYTLLNDTLQTQLTNIYNNMMSKKGTTNISQINDDLPMIISASALLDLNTLVQ